LSYLKEVSSKKNKQRKDEVSFEEAMVTLDVSSEEMQGLMSKKAITYRKSGDSIFVSRKEVEKYAEILLEKRLKGMEKIIQLQQEMGLYK